MEYFSKGFTLLEMLLTLALIGILLISAIPAWQHFIGHNRMDAAIRELVTALNFARSEAIKNSEKVIFCPSKNQRNCGGNWQEGQIIIMNNQVLRSYPRLPDGEKLLWRSSLGRNDRLEFVATGFTNGQKGSFLFCWADQRYAKRIVIEQSGRARMADDDIHC